MGSVPGPIISFRISQPELAGAVQPALQQIRSQSQTVSNQIAEDWRRMAAQIRASMAQGLAGDKETLQLRTQLIGVLDRQISGYRQLNELSTKELASLKAVTLERERQADAIKRGVGVGVTAGTSSALGQVSSQTVLGIGRILDSLVNRYFGGAAGALTRTVRDAAYYSNQAGGSGGIAGGLSAIGSVIPGSVLAVGGLTVGLTALSAAALAVTHNMTETAHSINLMAAETGLNTTQVQEYTELAKEMNLDANALVNSFARLDAQLGKYLVTGKGADESTQQFVRVAKLLGVTLEDSSKNIRPVNDIVGDFADKLQTIPNAGIRAELAIDAFGIRGKILAEAMNIAAAEGRSLRDVLKEISGSDVIIPEDQVGSLDRARTKWEELSRAVRGYVTDIKEGIAGGVLGTADFFSGVAHLPQTIGDRLTSLRYFGFSASGAGSAALGPGGAPNVLAGVREQQAANEALVRQAQEIAGTSRLEVELAQARKELEKDISENLGAQAVKAANQVASLKAAVDLERQRAEQQKRLAEFLLNPGGGSLAGVRGRNSTQALIQNLLNPGQDGAPDIGVGINTSTNYLAGVLGPAAGKVLNGADILQQINKEHEDLFKTQREIDAEHYQDELDTLNDALKQQLISQQEYNQAVIKLNQDRNKTLEDANKKYDDEAGKLFDDLLSGHTRDFTKSLLKDVEDIATGPVKKLFESLIGGQLQSLADIFSGKKSAGGAPGGSGSLKDVWNTIKGLWTGRTPGFFPGDTGSSPSSGSAGQASIGTMDVRAGVVNIYSLGVASAGGGLGNFFGANSLLGGTGNFFGNLNPFGGSGSSGTPATLPGSSTSLSSLGKVINAVNPYFAGAATLGLGLATGNEAAMAIGAASLAGKAANALSGISSLPPGLSSALGTFGAAAPGFGLAASGIIGADQSRTVAGKIGGTLEAGAGGALAGLVIGGPIGAAIGGAIGLIGGTIASIFGGGPQGFQQSVQHAMAQHQYHAPLSENFSFASNGSIANTLGTGFFQSGSQFSQYALPANTPFYASALTGHLTWQQLYQLQNSGLNPNAPFLGNPGTNPYVGQGPVGSHASNLAASEIHVHLAIPGIVDANSVASTLAPHAATIAQLVTRQLTNSSSGFANSARRSVFLP